MSGKLFQKQNFKKITQHWKGDAPLFFKINLKFNNY